MGRRMGDYTAQNTKCMVQVNGTTLIDRVMQQLRRAGVDRVVTVTGYKGDSLKDYLTGRYPDMRQVFVDNSEYQTTNNIYSLWLARRQMAEDDTLLLESDLIYEDAVLEMAAETGYDAAAVVARYRPGMDGTVVTLDRESVITEFIPKSLFNPADADRYYKTVNIYSFGRSFAETTFIPALGEFIDRHGRNEYYEMVLRYLTASGACRIHGLCTGNLKWYEIDNADDLHRAEQIFPASAQNG